MNHTAEPEILFETSGPVGVATLNRPGALNALNLAMIRALDRRLQAWAGDASVKAVVLRAAGGRAFWAGGDVRAVRSEERRVGEEWVGTVCTRWSPIP